MDAVYVGVYLMLLSNVLSVSVLDLVMLAVYKTVRKCISTNLKFLLAEAIICLSFECLLLSLYDRRWFDKLRVFTSFCHVESRRFPL